MAIGDRIQQVAGVGGSGARAIVGDAQVSQTALGNSQATAFQLTAVHTHFSTVAASTGAVVQSNLNAGDEVTVVNAGANALSVYPPVGGAFNGLAANTAISVPINKAIIVKCLSPTIFLSNLSA
jgi:hypothetical protein